MSLTAHPFTGRHEFLNRFFSIGLINLLCVVFVMTSQTKCIRDDRAKKCTFYGLTLFNVTHYLYVINGFCRKICQYGNELPLMPYKPSDFNTLITSFLSCFFLCFLWCGKPRARPIFPGWFRRYWFLHLERNHHMDWSLACRNHQPEWQWCWAFWVASPRDTNGNPRQDRRMKMDRVLNFTVISFGWRS